MCECNIISSNTNQIFCLQRLLYRLRTRYPAEIDATQLQHILGSLNCSFAKSIRGFRSMGGPSLDLCRALLALRDPALGGRLAIENVPPLITLLRFWKVCLQRNEIINALE